MLPVAITDLRFSYGRRPTLHGVDLAVRAGEVVCLAGPNGAGKSTLLSVLAGLQHDFSGEALLAGGRPGSEAARRAVGFVPAVPPLYDYLSVREHLELLSRLWGLPPQQHEQVAGLLDLDGELACALVAHLSLGQRQRLALALALLHGPAVLLLDEPFNGLDGSTTGVLRRIVSTHAAQGGTVLVATHLLAALDGLATRLLILHEGRVAADRPVAPGELLSDLHRRVQEEVLCRVE